MERRLNRTSASSWCRLGKEGAVLHKEMGMYFHLNESGVKLWELLEEPKEVKALSAALRESFDLTPEQAYTDVCAFADALIAAKLAEWKEEQP